jgi:hypothetical protein
VVDFQLQQAWNASEDLLEVIFADPFDAYRSNACETLEKCWWGGDKLKNQIKIVNSSSL